MNIEKIIRNYSFSREEVADLKEYRDNQKVPDLKLRFIALLLFAENTAFSVIISVTGKSRKTLKRWFGTYILSGPACLASYNYKPEQSFLTENQITYLISRVKKNHPADAETVRDFIKDRSGIACCTDAVRKILKKNGLKFFRAKTVPGDPPSGEEQRRFAEKI